MLYKLLQLVYIITALNYSCLQNHGKYKYNQVPFFGERKQVPRPPGPSPEHTTDVVTTAVPASSSSCADM